MTTAEVGEFIHSAPGIVEGFCQQTEWSQRHRSSPVPSGGGTFNYATRRHSTFRVFLIAEGRRGVEATASTARAALDAAMEAAKSAPKQ